MPGKCSTMIYVQMCQWLLTVQSDDKSQEPRFYALYIPYYFHKAVQYNMRPNSGTAFRTVRPTGRPELKCEDEVKQI